MNVLFPCKNCKGKEALVFSFSCEHKICYRCLIQDIFVNHLIDLSNNGNLLLSCNCDRKGTLQLDLNNIFTIFSAKPFINEQKPKDKCTIHKLEMDFYCMDCDKYICNLCSETKEDPHNKHNIIKADKLAEKLKYKVRQLPLKYKTIEEFNSFFEKVGKDLKKDIEKSYNKALQELDSIMELLQMFRAHFINCYKRKMDDGVFILKIIKLFYLNFFHDKLNVDTINSIESLNFLLKIKYELEKIKIEFDNGIFTYFESIKSHFDELNEMSQNCLNYSFSFSEIPTGFRKVQEIPNAHKKMITSLTSNDEDIIFSGGKDNIIKTWEQNDKKDYCPSSNVSELSSGVVCLLCLKDKRILSASSKENSIRVWKYNPTQASTKCYTLQQTFSVHSKTITSIHQLKDGRIVSAGLDKNIVISEDNEGRFENKQIIKIQSGEIYCIIDLNEDRFATASSNSKIIIWKADKDGNFSSEQVLSEHKQRVKALCFLKDWNLASAGDEFDIYIWTQTNNLFSLSYKLSSHTDVINSLILLNDGRFASSSKDKSIVIWENDGDKYKLSEKLTGHNEAIYSIIQLTDGRICSSDSDGNLILWMNK
ncbi:MAG: hypothetical protein MJ252_15890 [archaeon]|nr:hypothetical protein [archaeon]